MAENWTTLSDDERALVEALAKFCAAEIAPKAAATDEGAGFVREQLQGLAAMGVMGANLPESCGGLGLSAAGLFAVVECVAGACGSTVSALTAHYLATDSILFGGTDAQRQHWLPKAASGEALGAFALTEPTAGSDPADMKTRATREGSGWRLTGSKCFISNGGEADFIIVYALTNAAAGHKGISAFIVPRGTPGFTAGRPERTMGLKGGHVFTLGFDCLLPPEALLGAEGQGFKTAMRVLDNGRIEVAAMCTGIAQAALDAATAYARERVIGGEALAAKQGIRWQFAGMALELARARALAAEAVRQRQAAHETGQRFSLAAAMAKLEASEMAGRVTDAALQIHGGYGYTRDLPLERYARDVRIMRIYEGSSEIQRNIIAAHLFK
ncbi:MAG: acyl-CoA dehydrogenase family protein [Alphaproteobacteria bacterium]|nr:acyl-CoA dehydrogenase family protein [Alphaproteobacteria bacterium]